MSSSPIPLRLATEPVVRLTLEQIAREGARRALQKAIEDEVAEYLEAHRECPDTAGHRLVVGNGRKRYAYVWADEIYFGCRLADDRPCVLVPMGATADGAKELIAVHDGQR